MPEVQVVDSLEQVDQRQWDALFPGELEDYAYLLAVERAGLEGFRWRYVLAREAGELVAAAPAFLTEYALETTLAEAGRRLAEGVRRLFPDALTLRLACIGSPCTERALLGLSPSVATADQPALIRALLQAFEEEAGRERCRLLGLKDVAQDDEGLWALAAGPLGYHAIPSLPIAHLAIDFGSLEAYLARLTPSARKDMRRKLRAQARVRIEVRSQVDDVIDRIMALYGETRGRADMGLENLTAGYFQGVLRAMPGRAWFVLYYEGDDLLAANLILLDGDTLLDKYFGMDAARGRPLNLYFLSWFTNIELCLARGLDRYQAGQAAYRNKVRLGSRLEPTANYFRHRNSFVNGALRLAAPLFAAHPTERQAA